MDLGQLEAFDEVVRQGGFSQASTRLNLSQPSVSARIMRLEQELGGPLFRRGTRRLQLTELGQRFLPYARQALAVMQSGLQMAELTRSGEQGRLTVAALPTLAHGPLPRAVLRLHQTHPQVSVTVHTGHNPQVQDMLRSGFVSMGLLNLPAEGGHLQEVKRFDERLFLIVHPRHPILRLNRPRLVDLLHTGEAFLRIDWSWDVRNWQAHHIPARPGDLEVPPFAAHAMLKQGYGAALFPMSWVQEDLQSGRVVRVDLGPLDLPVWTWGVCKLKDHDTSNLQQAFVDLLES